MNRRVHHDGYLTDSQAIKLILVPAFIFLFNGMLVHILKITQAPAMAYTLFPLALLLLLALTILRSGSADLAQKCLFYSPVIILPMGVAWAHLIIFGTIMGSDSAYYYSNAFQTFFETGYFSYSEAPYIEFGEQPLANYWLPYNSEFIFAGLTALVGGEFKTTSYLMHFTSNYLFVLGLLCVALRFLRLITGIILSCLFLLFLYALLQHSSDFSATSLFRGFENKGFIWGYFLWAVAILLVPANHITINPKKALLAGAVLTAGACMVSGNAGFLMLPFLAFTASGIIGKSPTFTTYAGIGGILTLTTLVVVFKLFEVTDVYRVVMSDLTYGTLPRYEDQLTKFNPASFVWPAVWTLVACLYFIDRKLSFQLGVFLIISLFVHSRFFFNLFLEITPERGIIFWRAVVLMTPLTVAFITLCGILGRFSKTHQLGSLLGLFVAFMFTMSIGLLKIPAKTPFGAVSFYNAMVSSGSLCPAGSVVLSDRHFGTFMPVIHPSYKYLSGKVYFLNWQIANLRPESAERERAERVQRAMLYLSQNRTEGPLGEDPSGFSETLAAEKPDMVMMLKRRENTKNKKLLKDYKRTDYGTAVVYVNPKTC